MYVVGMLGSPRRGGNTETLLDQALAGAAETGATIAKIALCDYNVSGCIECNDCMETGYCTIGDEMDTIYQEIEKADRIILASPMFFMGVSSQTKAVIDRCQCYWALKYVLKQDFPRDSGALPRYGMFIGVGGTRGKNLFDGTMLTLKYFFDAISVERREDLYILIRGVDDQGDILKHEDAMDSAFDSGKRLAEL